MMIENSCFFNLSYCLLFHMFVFIQVSTLLSLALSIYPTGLIAQRVDQQKSKMELC